MTKTLSKIKNMTADSKHFWQPLYFFVLLLLGSLVMYLGSLSYYSFISSDSYYTGTITVTGHGEIKVTPDVRRLSIDIVPSESVTADSSQQATGTTSKKTVSPVNYVQKITSYLRSKGVSDADVKIQSSSFVSVKLHGQNMLDVDTISNDIEALSRKHIFVTVENAEVESLAKARASALDAALNDARINAIKVSSALDVDLGKVTSYYDQGISSPSSPYSDPYTTSPYDAYSGSSNEVSDSSGASSLGPVEPVTVNSDISVTYQVR
ncbi:MAG: SIMPL domain-containing protein [bacterium]